MTVLYKPFFDMDLKYRFDPSDFKPAPQARIVLASFERKQFPDVKKEEEKLYKDFWDPKTLFAKRVLVGYGATPHVVRTTRNPS